MKRIAPNKGDPFREILRNNPHPMWIFDHQTLQFLEVNPVAVANYGYSRSEFLQMKITDIRPVAQIPKLLAGIRPFRLDGAHIRELQHLTKNGCLIDVEITASQFYFKGRPAVFVEAQDITKRKEAEEKLRKMLEEKERSVQTKEGLVEAFTGIILQLQAADDNLPRDPANARRHIKAARLLARQSLASSQHSLLQTQIRSACSGHAAEALGEGNLDAALTEVALNPNRTTPGSELTVREKQVLELLTAGRSNKEIAADLNVAEGTVKIHVNHILRKLKSSARTEAAIIAIKTGLVRI